MKAQWQILSSKLEALSQRERWMVFAAGLVVIFAVLNALLISPVTKKKNQLTGEISQTQSQISEISQQLSSFAQNPVVDPDAQNRQKIAQMNQVLQAQREKISALKNTLISPEAMPDLLKGLLQKNPAIKLVTMSTLPPENILQKKAADHAENAGKSEPVMSVSVLKDQPVIYRHGVELTISGQYLDLLQYVEALESLPMHSLWRSALLQTKQFPESELTLRVYTLSLDKTWLSI